MTQRTPTKSQQSKAQLAKCPLCTRNESRNMVQCDTCTQRHHKACIGLEEAENTCWTCHNCGNVMEKVVDVQGSQDLLNSEAQTDKNSANTPTTTPQAGNETVNHDIGRTVYGSEATKVDKDYVSAKQPQRKDGERNSSSRSGSKHSTLRRKLQMDRLEEERRIVMERRRQQEEEDKAYLDKKYAILEESELSEIESSLDTDTHHERIQSWIADIHPEPILDEGKPTNQMQSPIVEQLLPPVDQMEAMNVRNIQPMAATSTLPPTIQPACAAWPAPDQAGVNLILPGSRVPPGLPAAAPSQMFSNTQLPPQPVQARILSAEQVASRHVVSKELPAFSGDPEEWPLFISSYENSSRTCGFSDDENMMRLQRCLKGKALEAVRFKLLMPSAVNDVINTLRLLYGRPEIIVSTLIQRVRNEPPIKADKLDTLIPFALSVQNLCSTIEVSGLVSHMQNPMLIQEIVDKLPAQLKLNWAMHAQLVQGGITLASLGNWLFHIAQAANTVISPSPKISTAYDPKARRSSNDRGFVNAHNDGRRSSTFSRDEDDRNCLVCSKSDHKVDNCLVFQGQNRSQRWETVLEKHLCRKCLSRHGHSRCSSKKKCGKDGCTYLHHPLLHNPEKVSPTRKVTISDSARPSNTHIKPLQSLLFRVIPVTLYGKTKSVHTYAFLDEGSSLTLLEQSIATELELDGTPDRLCLKWTAETTREEPDSQRVALQISSRSNQSRKYRIGDVRTVRSLNLPKQTLDVDQLRARYPYLVDTPVEPYLNATPKILIGIDHWKLGIPTECREGKWREPVATRTRLGWAIHGFCNHSNEGQGCNPNHIHHSYHTCDCSTNEDLHALVKDFFSMDNFGVKICETSLESKYEKRARELLHSTTAKVGDRYETGLLWKDDQVELPNSKPMATRRLICLEKKMVNEPELANNLKRQISEYVTKGYARKLSVEEQFVNHPRIWYLPIFTVTNPNKPAKVRLVWDAAAKVDGISLNSALLKGPDQLTPLPNVLSVFRQRKIAICGDIKEMFHQVRIRDQDQHSQRFLWRDGNKTKAPDTYVMQVMTFGATCSPSSAQYVKNTHALRYVNEYPRAVEAITKNHYVDDLLDSVDSINEAITLVNDVTRIHQQGGFEIRNWLSNSTEVLARLNITLTPADKNLNISPEPNVEKVLGMWWCTKNDTFTYSTNFNRLSDNLLTGKWHPTKREVLRTLMSIFDPLGFLAFYLVYMKILLQEIWRSGIDWDHKIGDEQLKKWKIWISILPEVVNVRIPRCYIQKITSERPYTTQLHIFVDASENAFAAVAYLRIEQDGIVECALVGAKTKVAPKKPMSIPRLELQAATLGTRLASSIVSAHTIKIDRRVFWSDSKTVMCWIRSDHRRYRQFVAFRIGEILESSNETEWKWIPTKMNVADEATKWSRTPSFDPNNRWFQGPSLLLQSENEWPQEVQLESAAESTVEVRAHYAHTTKQLPLYGLAAIPDRCYNWYRVLRVQAYVHRYIQNLKAKNKLCSSTVGPVTQEEYALAEKSLIRQTQVEAFPDEVALISSGKILHKSSAIYKCSPYMDSDGILCMKGRINNAPDEDVDINTKTPILLPRHHHITRLIVGSFHRRYHHHNHETVVNEVRQKFYVPSLRTVLKCLIRRCQKCRNASAAPNPPEMAELPRSRLSTHRRPFTHVGVDYFGPMIVKIGRRQEKRWGVLFTCLTVRAVHLEIANSLSTDSCIMCIRNFIARRGVPAVIHSDNGTNLRGADNELRAELAQIDHDRMHEAFTSPRTKWIFNPPGAPHMGGSWERLVGSVKKVLSSIMPTRTPSDELLRCVLMEAERVVNARPLTYMPIENDTTEALTPNHFLIGSSNGEAPVVHTTDRDLIGRKDWRIAQQLANNFWKRWILEYLPTLTRRSKWHARPPPIKVGDIVIIVDEKNPRNCWPKGVITETTATRDGQVRKAVVKTAHGTYERPAVKLAVLNLEPTHEG